MNEREFYKQLSINLKKIRKERSMTQEQFSILLNISFYYYQRIEAINTKQTISISLLLKICETLNVNLNEMIKEIRIDNTF